VVVGSRRRLRLDSGGLSLKKSGPLSVSASLAGLHAFVFVILVVIGVIYCLLLSVSPSLASLTASILPLHFLVVRSVAVC